VENIPRNSWEQAFGSVPAGFAYRVKETVQKMESGGIRVKRRFLPIIAFMVLMLAGTALALNSLGLLTTLTNNLRSFLQPEAKTMVQRSIVQSGGVLSSATFTVEEAIYDCRQIYALIRVHAKDPAKTLLMDSDAEPSWGMDWWKHFNAEEGQTFSSKAYGSGRNIIKAEIYPSLESDSHAEIAAKEIAYDGEDILYTLTLLTDGSTETAPEFSISAYNVYRDDLPHDQRLETGIPSHVPEPPRARQIFWKERPARFFIDTRAQSRNNTKRKCSLRPSTCISRESAASE
jgi:hypothetical protein